MIIEKHFWHISAIDGKRIQDLAKVYGGKNIYYTKVFCDYLMSEYNISPKEYFVKYCKIETPICLCGICNQESQIIIRSSNFKWRDYICGRNKGIMEWSKNASTDRLGENNPMYGKIPWNKGLDVSDIRVKAAIDKLIGRKTSEEVKMKQSESAKKRKIHGHSGRRHTPENIEKFRQNTLKMIKSGAYKQTKTKPHIEMSKILTELGLSFEEEKMFNIWCIDFYLPSFDLYIEVDGDYFHSNPKIYPNGPKTKTQKINAYRDKKKNIFFEEQKLKLIRFWESDILSNPGEIKCLLKKLFQ